MAASVFDSPMFTKTFPTGEAARLFTDSAAVRAVLLVQGTLAKVQGELGITPEDSAFFIHRSSMEVQIDPAGLAEDMARGGLATAVCSAFQKAMEAPEHAKYIQQGVTSPEVEAAALSLRLRQFISHCENRVASLANAACNEALSDARQACVGLYLQTDPSVGKALGDALRLPLFTAPADVLPLAQAAALLTETLATSKPTSERLQQLHSLTQGLLNSLGKDTAALAYLCLPQICLAAAAALEITDSTHVSWQVQER